MDKPMEMINEIDALLNKLKTLPQDARVGLVNKIQERLSEVSCPTNGLSSSCDDYDGCSQDGEMREKSEECYPKNKKKLALEDLNSKDSKKVEKYVGCKRKAKVNKPVKKKESSLLELGKEKCLNKQSKSGQAKPQVFVSNRRRSSVLPIRYSNFTDVPEFLVPHKKNGISHFINQDKESSLVKDCDDIIRDVHDSRVTNFPETSNTSHNSEQDSVKSADNIEDDDYSNDELSDSKNSRLLKKKGKHKQIINDADRTCNICQRTYVNSSYLRIHMRKHTGEKPYQCLKCDKKFSQKSSLCVHNKRHEGKYDHKCNLCDYKSVLKIDLLRHESKHTGKKIYICEQCGKMFTTDMRLKDHIRHVHERSETHVCDKCGFSTHRADNLRRHIAVKHSDDEYFKCPVCGDILKQRSTFIVHLRRHTGERPHACTECGKGFKSLSQLAVHRRIHKEGQHVCPECHHKFKTKHHLDRHSVIHTGIKPYSCTYCSYSCNVKGNINKHMKAVHKLVNFSFRKQKNSDNDSALPLSYEKAAIDRGNQVTHEFLERISLRKDEQLTVETLQKQLVKNKENTEEIPVIKTKLRSSQKPKSLKTSEDMHKKSNKIVQTISPSHDVTVNNLDNSQTILNNRTEQENSSETTATDGKNEEGTNTESGNSPVATQTEYIIPSSNENVVSVVASGNEKNQNGSNVLFLSVKEVVNGQVDEFSPASSVALPLAISDLEQASSAPTIYLITLDQ